MRNLALDRIRADLKKALNKYGVDRFSLFPSLDGLAAHIEWLQSKGHACLGFSIFGNRLLPVRKESDGKPV